MMEAEVADPGDIALTIDSTKRRLMLARENGRKMWQVTEIPAIPLKMATGVPSYENLPPEKQLPFQQKDWRGGWGEYDFIVPDRYSDGENIDTRLPAGEDKGIVILGPLLYQTYSSDVKGAIADDGGVQTDETTAANEDTANDVTLLPVTPAVNDAYYFGAVAKHAKITITIGTQGVGTWTITWEYYNGTTWAALAGVTDGTTGFTATTGDKDVTFTQPADWTTNTIASISAFWVRARVSAYTSVTTQPKATRVQIDGGQGTLNGQPIAFEFFLNQEYLITSTKVYRYDGTRWRSVLTVSGDTLKCLGIYDNNIYAGQNTGKYYYSATGAIGWTLATITGAVAHGLMRAAPLDGSKELFVLFKTANEVRTSISPTNVGGSWVEPYNIGEATINITGLATINDIFLIGKEDGLYHLTSSGRPAELLPEFKTQMNSRNFKYFTGWQSSLYFSIQDDVGEITSYYTYDVMGPLALARSLSKTGYCVGLASDVDNLYAGIYDNTNYFIFTGRERTVRGNLRWEWCPLLNNSTNACQAIRTMQRTGANARLWFGYGNYAAYIILSPNPLGDTNYRYAATGFLTTSYFDAGFETWDKIFHNVKVNAQGITANTNIKVYYEKDNETSWTQIGSALTVNGISTLYPTAAIGCKRIRFKVELNTTANTATPELRGFLANGILKPEYVKVFDFVVVGEQGSQLSTSTLATFLEGGRTSTALITLVDRLGTSHNVIFMPGSPTEIEVRDERSKESSLGFKIQAQKIDFV